MATALGAGILIDATILRALLVPALVALCSAAGTGGSRRGRPGCCGSPSSVPAPEPAEPSREQLVT